MKTPDITRAQVLGTVQALVAVAVGVGMDAWQIVAMVVPISVAQIIADAIIRNGRARALANPESLRELERPARAVINDE